MPNLQTVKAKVAAADAAQRTGGLMTRKVDAAVSALMRAKLNPNQAWQVVLVLDRSGSMDDEYRAGSPQEAVDRALGFAVLVDDDGQVPTLFFDNRIEEVTVDLDNFHQLVQRNRISARGSTDLTSALRRAGEIVGLGSLFQGRAPQVSKLQTPAYIIVVTDGQPDDARGATDAIRRLSYGPAEIKFLYVGHNEAGWKFLEGLDDDIPVGVSYERGGRLFDNVDAKRFSALRTTTDAVFYDAMFDEVPGALAAMRQHGLI